MRDRTLGVLLLALGLMAVLVALFADPLFGGPGRHEGFGNLQLLGLLVGLAVAVAGGWITRKS